MSTLDHAEAATSDLGQAYFMDLLGDAYNGLGRYDEAIVALTEAARAFRARDERSAHAVCLYKIAQSHLAGGHPAQAARYLEDCLPVFSELRLPDYERQARRALAGCRRPG